jgi:hypothetical protein
MGIKEGQSLKQYIDEIQYRKYSDMDLKSWHEKIQRFYEEAEDINGKYKFFNKQKLLIAYGAIGPSGGVVLTNILRDEKIGNVIKYDRPTRQEQFDNLWEQYENWKYRNGLIKQTAPAQKVEALEEMAAQMTVEPSPEEIPF